MVRTDGRVRDVLRIGDAQLRLGERTYVMGIVNVTPDSFSGDGVEDANEAAEHAVAQWDAGADLLDIGGESTRPGHRAVDESLEIARVVPVIRALRRRLPSVPISIDTYKPAVLRAARDAGADMVNSVWGAPEALVEVVADLRLPMVIMHNQNGTSYDGPVVDCVLRYLEQAADRASDCGVAPDSIILDPGIGFGKTAEQNIAVLRELDRFVALGRPTMIGTSRKSTLGKLTGRDPADRVYATAATTALAALAGIDVVRVHDVAAARDCVAIADAIVRDWRPAEWTR